MCFQVSRELRPLLEYIAPPIPSQDIVVRENSRDMYANYMNQLRSNCVNNPQVQRDLYGSGDQSMNNLVQCWPIGNDTFAATPEHLASHQDLVSAVHQTWIVSTEHGDASRLKKELAAIGYSDAATPAAPLISAQREHLVATNGSAEHLRASFIAVVKSALASPPEQDLFIILQDTDTLVCDFKRKLRGLSESARCGAHLLWPRASGVLYVVSPSLAPCLAVRLLGWSWK